MNKERKNYEKVLGLFLFIFICFSFFSSSLIATAYWEYQNPDTTKTEICEFADTNEAGCNARVKTACGQTTTGVCVPSTDGCNSSMVAIDCPTVVNITGNNNTNSNGTYTLLAPIGEMTTAPPDFGTYVNKIFLIAIGLCGVLAVIMLIIGGIQYMGDESIFGKTEAKKQMINAILGLLIALGAWVLLNTINPKLLNSSVSINAVTAAITSPDIPQAQPATGQSYPGTSYKVGDAWPSDQTNRATLQQAGISVSGSNCTTVGQSGCTSVYNLNNSVLLKLKSMCTNCDLVVTGGTEFWLHAANTKLIHYPGGFTADLQKTASLTALIHSWSSVSFKSWYQGNAATCYYSNGIGIVEESNHFHVFSATGSCTTQGV